MALGTLAFSAPPDGELSLAAPGPGAAHGGRLDFAGPPDGELAFGTAPPPGPGPGDDDALLALDADIGALHCDTRLGTGHRAALDADIGAIDADASLLWDANVSRGGLRAELQSRWQQGVAQRAAARSHWQQAAALQCVIHSRWQTAAQPLRAATRPHWQEAEHLRAAARAHWQEADRRRGWLRTAWQEAIRLRAATRSHWQQADTRRAELLAAWQETIRLRAAARSHWQPGQAARAAVRTHFGPGLPRRAPHRSHWQEAWRPRSGTSQLPPLPSPHQPCYDLADLGKLQFWDEPSGPGVLAFWCRPYVLPPATLVIARRRSYIVINSIDLIRVDGSHPLPAYTFGLRLDADSWTWQWSATLHKDALPLLQPAQAGTPVEVQATINGAPYRLLVESVRRARQFASTRVEVSGRGLAALLDAPYAPVQAFGNQAPRSAQQLMTDVLTINGVGMGWALDFGLTDWQVPAGAFAHQGTWISAINTIAQAAGGYVQPHPTAQTLRILHRYPVAPWAWGGLTPDIDLPMAAVAVEGVEWVAKPAYNRVFVSGEGVGVLADVTRAGTPGDLAAPMVVDALITDTDAATQRGRAILSDTGSQALATLTLQVLPETGLILPGRFVRRTDTAETLQGLVRATSLTWDAPRMRQTIEVQTHA